MEEQTKVYSIPSDNLGVLADKFKKLARRAKKLGLPAPTYTEVSEPIRKQKKDGAGNVMKTWLEHQIVVDPGCTEVKVNGWTFVATIQHTEEGNIIRAVGHQEIPTKYRNVSTICEHCNTNRNRKDTYVLKHESSETKQVGRNCLADFFGHDALMYAERAQYLADIDSLGESMEDDFGFGGGKGGPSYEPLEIYLSYVAAVINCDGWLSRFKARQMSEELGGYVQATCDVALDHLHPRNAGNNFKPLFTSVSPEAVKMAEDAIEWASEIEGEDVAEYLHNIRIIARRMVWERRDMGMAASIVAAYQRHLSKLRWEEIRAKRSEIAAYVGNVGDKIRIKVVVEKVVPLLNSTYPSYLHIMSTNEGNVFIWFASSNVSETGKEIVLQGTIKAHNEREGVKQNILSRCSEVEMKNYFTYVGGQMHKFEAANENEVKKLLREKLSLKKLPNGTRIMEDIPQEVSNERVAV